MPYTLVFRAPVPALSFAVFYVARTQGGSHAGAPAHALQDRVVHFVVFAPQFQPSAFLSSTWPHTRVSPHVSSLSVLFPFRAF